MKTILHQIERSSCAPPAPADERRLKANSSQRQHCLKVGLLLALAAWSAHAQTVPLAEALDNTNLVWTTGGPTSWFGQTTNTHDGVDAAQSGAPTFTQTNWIETSVVGPASLSFWWKVSSKTQFDRIFCLYINGAEMAKIYGGTDWQPKSLQLGAGTNVIRWAFASYGSSGGQSYACVDQVQFCFLLGTWSGFSIGEALGVAVTNGLAYVAMGEGGLAAFDISDPARPVQVGGCDSGGHASGVQVVGNRAYVASDGLEIIDISNPSSPVPLGRYDTWGSAHDVQVVGNRAYVTDGTLKIVDVSNPAHPALLSYYYTGGMPTVLTWWETWRT
jgi:hypothetical protein